MPICQPRLLSHLRSHHWLPSRKSCRPPNIPKLQTTVTILYGMLDHSKALRLLRLHTTFLLESFTRLEALWTTEAHSKLGRDIMKGMLLSIESMLALDGLGSTLDALPRNLPSWSDLACKNLVESFKKLAQYQSAAQYLLHAT